MFNRKLSNNHLFSSASARKSFAYKRENAKMPLTGMKSSKGKELLIYDGYEFIFKRTNRSDNKKIWRCRKVNKYNCPSPMTTKGLHDGDPRELQRSELLNQVNQTASNSHQTIRFDIGDTLIDVQNDVQARLLRNLR